MKNIIMLAPPAAGKGTLSKKLSEKFGYVQLSTGDILRDKAKTDKALAAQLGTGTLIDDATVFQALEEKLNALGDKPYILDGFPRTVEQAILYEDLLKKINKSLGIVIYLDVDKETLKKRVVTRVSCPLCKKPYSLAKGFFYPIDGKTCNDCHVDLIRRKDDTEEAFEIRYDEYLEKTAPLVDFYEKTGSLFRINSSTAEEIYNQTVPLIK